MYKLVVVCAVTIVLVSCIRLAPPPHTVEPLARQINFLDDVKPVLDSRCAVCHSCYNAACQLKLSSFEGADRGGSKVAVYASRLRPTDPTRATRSPARARGARRKRRTRGRRIRPRTGRRKRKRRPPASRCGGRSSLSRARPSRVPRCACACGREDTTKSARPACAPTHKVRSS